MPAIVEKSAKQFYLFVSKNLTWALLVGIGVCYTPWQDVVAVIQPSYVITVMGAQRTAEGAEIAYARSRLLTACKAAGVLAIDTPFPFVSDLARLEKDAALAVQLGFDGKAVISPQHVHRVNHAFVPAQEKINWARRVMAAAKLAEAEGKGAVSLDGMMIDLPIIKRAERILLLADV
jgi:Citrate lyase beta subunit